MRQISPDDGLAVIGRPTHAHITDAAGAVCGQRLGRLGLAPIGKQRPAALQLTPSRQSPRQFDVRERDIGADQLTRRVSAKCYVIA